jgi:hypothetical protein
MQAPAEQTSPAPSGVQSVSRAHGVQVWAAQSQPALGPAQSAEVAQSPGRQRWPLGGCATQTCPVAQERPAPQSVQLLPKQSWPDFGPPQSAVTRQSPGAHRFPETVGRQSLPAPHSPSVVQVVHW